jgi:hypothetical protein
MDKILPAGVVIADINEASALLQNFTPKVGWLGKVKRGDFLRLLLRFTRPASGDKPENPRATEFITCVVASKTDYGLLKTKVFSRPEMTQFHSVTYGDDITVSERYVLQHEQSGPSQVQEVEPFLTGVIPISQPVNEHDAKLRAVAQDLPPMAPQSGRQYWLRNGTLVTVFAFHVGVWIGSNEAGATLEWTATGQNAQGNRDLDIVKDPRASEVVA